MELDGTWFLLTQLLLPAEDSRLVGGQFGFGDQSFFMQSDGQGGERKWIVGFELRQLPAGSYRFVKAVQLLQCACESVKGLRVRGIQRQTSLVFRNGFFIFAFCKQIEGCLEESLSKFAIRSHSASVSMATMKYGSIGSLGDNCSLR